MSWRRLLSRPWTGAVVAGLAAVVAAGALALLPGAPASAHDYLVDSSPKAGSTQTSPISTVSLTFNDVVLDLSHNGSSALLQVTGPNGATRHFETGCPKIAGRVVSAPVALGATGKYTVTWQIVSADGHTVSDSIQFSYAPPARTKAAGGSTNRPSCGQPGSASSAQASAAATPRPATASTTSGSLAIVITIAGIIVLLAVIAVVVLIVTARRRSPDGAQRHPDDD
jgi:methionine-rich copper-binding protein CopC